MERSRRPWPCRLGWFGMEWLISRKILIPVAARAKAWIAAARLLGLQVRIQPGGHGYLSLSVVGCQVNRSPRRGDHSSKRVLPWVVRPVRVIAKPRKGRPRVVVPEKKKNNN